MVGVDYRLTPEAPYPAPVDDLCEVIDYFRSHAGAYGMNAEKTGVIGFSGGATLAAAAAMRQAEAGTPLAAAVLHYPYLDSVRMPAEKEHFDCDMDPAVMAAFTKLYAKPEERALAYVSPVYASAEDLKGFPKTMILPAEKDALRSEGLAFAEKLQQAGVPVYVRVMPEVHHGYVEDAGNMAYFDAVTLPDTKQTLSPYFTAWAAAAIKLSACFFAENLRDTQGGAPERRDL